MQSVMRQMMKRQWKSDRMLAVWIVTVIFITYQIYSMMVKAPTYTRELSALDFMVEFEPEGTLFMTYVFVLPLLVAFVASQLYIEDKAFYEILMTRMEHVRYLTGASVASFLTGACVAVIPLIVSAIVVMVCFPFRVYPYQMDFVNINSNYFSLWQFSPLLFWFFSLLQIALFGGIYALFGFCISLFAKSRFVESVAAFVVIFIAKSLEGYLFFRPVTPSYYLNMILDDPTVYGDARWIKWGTVLLFFAVCIALLYRKSEDEILL